MGARAALGQDRRVVRLDGDDLDGSLLLLQVFAGARDGAAGADAGNEDVDRAVGVFEDLRTGGGFMDGGVRRVDELTGDEAAGDLRRQLIRFGDGALHALRAFGQDDLRTVGFQDVAALHAHGLGHREDGPVALGSRDGSEADAGVAGGRLDNDGALFQETLRLGVLDHRLRDTVLDASGRVEVFEFDEKGGLQVQFLFDVGDFDERGVPDELDSSFIDVCHDSCLLSVCFN